jgi:hypothetical protein
MKTQIFLLLLALGEVFLVYCLIQFGLEWSKVRANRIAARRIRVSATAVRDSNQVLYIADWTRKSRQQGARRMAS